MDSNTNKVYNHPRLAYDEKHDVVIAASEDFAFYFDSDEYNKNWTKFS